MQREEIIGAADSLSDVVGLATGTVRDMHRAITGRGFAQTARWLGPFVRPVRAVHDTVTAATYAAVRTGLSATISGGGRIAAALRADGAPSVMDRPRGSRVVGTVNGIVGDRLARQRSPLDVGMTLRHDGRCLPATREALATAHPSSGGRIAVFVPGLCETEAAWRHRADEWHPDAAPTHGERLHGDLGLTPLWVRYNSGRRVSDNGADLARMLDAVERHWPVPVEQMVLVGYSMGGLILRSALHHAAAHGAAWPGRVTHVVSLGCPHHGTPLEKLGNVTTWALGGFAQTRALGAFFNHRSAGIKDLRYGNVTDADWLGRHPDALLRDTRVVAASIDGIPHHAMGAVMDGLLGRLLGDGMVRLNSATGRHRRRPLTFHGQTEVRGLSHVALRNHPEVYRRLLGILAEDPRSSTHRPAAVPSALRSVAAAEPSHDSDIVPVDAQ